MRVNDLVKDYKEQEELVLLRERCSQFLEDARGLPLLKNLSEKYGDFHKVKVRYKKTENRIDETFNDAFGDGNLRQRAIFANGPVSFEPFERDGLEPFFIFPVDGYTFMYSSEVEHSGTDYKQVFDSIFEQFGSNRGKDVIADLLKFTYTHENLHEGIERGSEIILLNIPFFYAIRMSIVDDYTELLSSISEIE